MEDDKLALKGVGRRELLPSEGLPFETDTGQPKRSQTNIASLSTRDAMAMVRWDFDPLKESINNGSVSVGKFFEVFG